MEMILRALRRAGRDLFTGRMIVLLFLPMGLSLLLWGGLAWFFGSAWQASLVQFLTNTPLQSLARWTGAEWLLPYAAILLLILLWLPAVYVSALMVTSLALMPVIIRHIESRDYALLERRRGGTLAGSVVNGIWAILVYLLAWLLTLPLWLLGPMGLLMSLWLNTWLNQRLFLYDALSEHADASELRAVRKEGGWQLYALSGILSLLHLVPFVNLVAPVYMGLAFGHFALGRLMARRGGMP
jgi:hypothetical protein